MEHVSFYHIKIQETTGTICTILNIIQNWILRVEYHYKICALHFDNKHLHYNFICNKTLIMLISSKTILLCSHFVYSIVTFSQLFALHWLSWGKRKMHSRYFCSPHPVNCQPWKKHFLKIHVKVTSKKST